MQIDTDETRIIMIMRHAKSEWGDESITDFDRPLSRRGKNDAPRMGSLLRACGAVPEAVVASPSLRTMQTASRLAEAAGYTGTIDTDPEMYHGDGRTFLEALRQTAPRHHRVLLIGHYPGVQEALSLLLGKPVEATFPTGAIACFAANADTWANLQAGGCSLLWFIHPRLIKAVSRLE